jgi:hypothetical protein
MIKEISQLLNDKSNVAKYNVTLTTYKLWEMRSLKNFKRSRPSASGLARNIEPRYFWSQV